MWMTILFVAATPTAETSSLVVWPNIIAAFLGFFVAAGLKFMFDWWTDNRRRAEEKRTLAAVLHGGQAT